MSLAVAETVEVRVLAYEMPLISKRGYSETGMVLTPIIS